MRIAIHKSWIGYLIVGIFITHPASMAASQPSKIKRYTLFTTAVGLHIPYIVHLLHSQQPMQDLVKRVSYLNTFETVWNHALNAVWFA